MAFTLLILACLLFYASSRYFPSDLAVLSQSAQKQPLPFRIAGGGLLTGSWGFMLRHYDPLTATVVWMMALMLVLSALVISLKVHRAWLIGWGLLTVGFLVHAITT